MKYTINTIIISVQTYTQLFTLPTEFSLPVFFVVRSTT